MELISTCCLSAVALGAFFGVQGSVAPGPLQTVIISESLSRGIRSSWRAATISLVSDPFALVVAVLFVANLPNAFIAGISFLGALTLFRIAWLQFRTTVDDFHVQTPQSRLSFFTIWTTNMFNPNLWIFSFTINAVQISQFFKEGGFMAVVAYLSAFFVAICSCNLLIAFIVSKSRRFFDVKRLVGINRILGVFLLIVAVRFVYIGFSCL